MEENEKKGLSQTKLIILVIAGIFLMGVLVWFSLRLIEEKEAQQELSIQELEAMAHGMEFTYDGYLDNMEPYNTTVISEGLYSIQLPEAEQETYDKAFNDPYNGFEYNENLHYAVHELSDGYYLLLYQPETRVVFESTSWKRNAVDTPLEIYQKKGEKSELIEQALQTDDQQEIESLKEEIASINVQLTELHDMMMNS